MVVCVCTVKFLWLLTYLVYAYTLNPKNIHRQIWFTKTQTYRVSGHRPGAQRNIASRTWYYNKNDNNDNNCKGGLIFIITIFELNQKGTPQSQIVWSINSLRKSWF